MPWPPWAPQSKGVGLPFSPGVSMRSDSMLDDFSPGEVKTDALGTAYLLRTESLTAICLLIIASCALGFMLFFLRAILIPFAIAVFLMYLLQPMVNYLCKPPRRWCDKCVKRRGEVCCEGCIRVTKSRAYSQASVDEVLALELQVERQEQKPSGWGCYNKPLIPRWMAVILAISFVLTALAIMGAIVYGSILNLQTNFGKYEEGAENIATDVDTWLKKYHYSLDQDFLPFVLQKIREQVPRTLKTLLTSLEYCFLVAIFLVYLLISPVKPIKSSVWGIIDLHIRRYIRLKTTVAALVAAVVTFMLWMLGVQMSHVFGIMTFALHFLPNLGPLIATVAPMPLVIFDPDLSTLSRVFAFVGPTTAHMIVGNFVEPALFGESFELSPVVVLLSLAFWGSLWGIPGMILAVPNLVIARIVCDHLHHPYAKTFMRLLEGNVFDAKVGAASAWTQETGSGNVEKAWSDGRPDEELLAAEVGAGRNPSRRSTSSGMGEDTRRYGATSDPQL